MKKLKEKILGLINRVTDIKNLNELARKNQHKNAYWVAIGLGIFIFIGWFFMRPQGDDLAKDSKVNQEPALLAGTVDPQFDQESSKRVMDEQQREISRLNETLTAIKEQLGLLQQGLDEKNQEAVNDNKLAVQELQAKIVVLEAMLKRSSEPGNPELGVGASTKSITTTSFFYRDDQKPSVANQGIATDSKTVTAKNAKDYVPPGTFAKAVLLSGADTNAGVHGQTDTVPIVMRILDNGTMPNGGHTSLKGCFVTAAAYGDASSERGQIRLQRLSCIRFGDHILDIPVEGTINDRGGNDGIRGHVVMRNNRLIWNAGISGVLSGIGNAMQQSATTQAISPLGVTSAIKSGKTLEHSAYGGANTALGKLADYYIKLADMYHPIVQVRAGSQVTVVFLKGFSLTDGLPEPLTSANDEAKNEKIEITNSYETGNPDFNQAIKNSQLGQPITEDTMKNEEVK